MSCGIRKQANSQNRCYTYVLEVHRVIDGSLWTKHRTIDTSQYLSHTNGYSRSPVNTRRYTCRHSRFLYVHCEFTAGERLKPLVLLGYNQFVPQLVSQIALSLTIRLLSLTSRNLENTAGTLWIVPVDQRNTNGFSNYSEKWHNLVDRLGLTEG